MLAVVGYHLWPQAITGGYIGVDVFFVISGFLITSHLVSEVDRTGTVSLPRFWARRIRRLLPAASIVLVAAVAAMVTLVPPSLWQRTGTEIAASALYVQNWVLAANSIDYLGATGTPSVVQHFWSLSVEEQFYLAWPILIVLTLLVSRRFRARRSLLVLLAAIFAVSLGYSVIATALADPAAYFSTGTRAWEFAAGGLLAFLPAAVLGKLESWKNRTAGVALAGWVLIIGAAFVYTKATPFPGWFALVPVLGTVLVIAAGTPEHGWSVNRITRAWPFRQVGDLSYAIYLWHWPLIVIVPYLTLADLTDLQKVGILAVTIGLAILVRRFVERPTQRSVRFSARPWRSYLFAAVTALVIVSLSVTGTQALSTGSVPRVALSEPCFGAAAMVNTATCARPFEVPDDIDTVAAAKDQGSLGLPCDSRPAGDEIVQCTFGDRTDPVHTMAVVGNSHAGHLIGALEEYGKAHKWKIILMRRTGCAGILTTAAVPGTDSSCIDWSAKVRDELLSRTDIDTVVFGTNRDSLGYFTRREALSASDDALLRTSISTNLAALESAGKTVMVIGDVPGHFDDPTPECVYLNRTEYDPCATPATQKESPTEVNYIADAAVRSNGAIGYFDLTPYFCDETLCHVMIGGVIAYIDENHMSRTYARSVAPYLGEAIDKELDKTGQ